MTEDEWRKGAGFYRLEDRPLVERITHRRVALAAIAWVWRYERYWAPLPSPSKLLAGIIADDRIPSSLEVAERWADGLATADDLAAAAYRVRDSANDAQVVVDDLIEDNEEELLRRRAEVAKYVGDVFEALQNLSSLQRSELDRLANAVTTLSMVIASEVGFETAAQNVVCDLEATAERAIIHDIFGNPFRPVAFDPAWRTQISTGIATRMYKSREFFAMPILAYALEEAGCDNAAVLLHCRELGAHVRGCWVVDLVLGKQ